MEQKWTKKWLKTRTGLAVFLKIYLELKNSIGLKTLDRIAAVLNRRFCIIKKFLGIKRPDSRNPVWGF